MTQGFFILWNTIRQHFTFRLTQHIIPQGCLVVGFVPAVGEELRTLLDKERLVFRHTAEVPDFDDDQAVDAGGGRVLCMNMDSYIEYIWDHLYFEDDYLDTSFMFKALEPVPYESITAPDKVPFQGNQPDDLNFSPEEGMVWE